MISSYQTSNGLGVSHRLMAVIALSVAVPLLPSVAAADSAGTITGRVDIPRAGGFWGDITFYRQDGDGDATADRVVTTSDGKHYQVSLPAGSYKVGFSEESGDDFGAAYYKNATTLGAATTVTVAAGAETENIDAALDIDPSKGQVSGRISAPNGSTYSGNVAFYRVDGE